MAPVSAQDSAIIHHKKAQYCRLSDCGQWDELAPIFLDSCKFIFTDPQDNIVDEGGIYYDFPTKDKFFGFLKSSMSLLQTIHIVGPAELEQTAPDEIKAVWPLTYQTATKGPAGGFHGTGGGHYFETWKKVGDDWFIGDLKMKRIFWKTVIYPE
ncbi:hypothetical protein AJ80_05072 [Polytolypa hystricis UAMH7299]|uniref:SnoaL-like domain-containing protein n=1 Tax=Polytolypa hystricis (strain UAMH7299) TaxID=1447883 RepID=A0A2B7Y816_POLH7|nr:hypothetical protein AJ80_05072 [Polytolypa hystricis UAMH7299]